MEELGRGKLSEKKEEEEEEDWTSEKRWSRLLFECLEQEQDRTGVGKKGVGAWAKVSLSLSLSLSPFFTRDARARESNG